MLGNFFLCIPICFLASSDDVFLFFFFLLLFAKYIMTFYLPWSRALRPLCGFPILAISQINHRSLCKKYHSLHEDRVIFMQKKQVYTEQLDYCICRYEYRIHPLVSFFLISTKQLLLKQCVTEEFWKYIGRICIIQ